MGISKNQFPFFLYHFNYFVILSEAKNLLNAVFMKILHFVQNDIIIW